MDPTLGSLTAFDPQQVGRVHPFYPFVEEPSGLDLSVVV
jgi:hypothetical protein